MQQMHQSYKLMLNKRKLVGVHPTCLFMKTKGILRKPIVGIYKPSSIMKNSHQYMKVTTYETLYHEDHGAILTHTCGKRDSSIALLFIFFFSSFFLFPFFFFFVFWPFFFFFFYLAFLFFWPFFFWDNALLMMIITLPFIYNSKITTRYQNKV